MPNLTRELPRFKPRPSPLADRRGTNKPRAVREERAALPSEAPALTTPGPSSRRAMGAGCSTGVAEGGDAPVPRPVAAPTNGVGEGERLQRRASVELKEVESELATTLKPGRRSSEITAIYDQLGDAPKSQGGERLNKRRSWIAHPTKLYTTTLLTDKLTGPWSVVIPSGTVYVGHKIPDTDAICSAIAAAELFNGVPARAGNLNSETDFVLKKFAVGVPKLYSDLAQRSADAGSPIESVCLMDHNQMSQVPDGVDLAKVIGVIDHHAFQNATICTKFPIYVDIRPWGSASTIVAHAFIQHRHALSKSSAALLLAGIISDTLSLSSPTTTEYDRMMVTFLAYAAGIDDVETLAKEMFQAKSRELESLTAYALVRGDLKKFDTRNTAEGSGGALRMAIGVVECTDPSVVLRRREEIVHELQALKLEDEVDMAFLIVVDIVKLYSEVIPPDADELDLACQAFEAEVTAEKTLKLQKGRVSRKLDFMPSLVNVLEKGWVKKNTETAKVRQTKRQSLAKVVYVEKGGLTMLDRQTVEEVGEEPA